jgi:dihydroorotate dehydrogenase
VSLLYRAVARPALFRIGGGDPEIAHDWTLNRLAHLSRRPALLAPLRARYAVEDPVTIFGVRFANRVGLAAGMDKNGVALPAWPALGFGFVEVGTVTANAQPGNDRPRLFRLPRSNALINRMGFNNAGSAALAGRLRAVGSVGVPIGVSLGKSRSTPLGAAVEDYLSSLRLVRPFADYIAVNVSSPNTPGLRSLQDRAALDELVAAMTADAGGVPILVKIAPDLSDRAVDEVLEVCHDHGVAGLIATNTTLDRAGVAGVEGKLAAEVGGLSGAPLTGRARAVVSYVSRHTDGRLPIIGVGGVMSPDDAERLIDAGASLVQLYTGFVYQGPALVRGVATRLRRSRSERKSPPGSISRPARVPLAPGVLGRPRSPRRDPRA